jgi:hypothetical protein
MADQYAGGRGRLNKLGSDVLTTIAAFTELADVASFALTSRRFASAIKNAEHSLGPALAAKYAPAVLALHPMLADPKPSIFVFFKRHLRAKAASTAPQPVRVPRSSLADYCFSYELFGEAGETKAAWSGQARFNYPGDQRQAIILMPLDSAVTAAPQPGPGEDESDYLQFKDLKLTVYIIKTCTAEVVKIYDGRNNTRQYGWESNEFDHFEFAPCLWHPSQTMLCMFTDATIHSDAHELDISISVGDDYMSKMQADFLLELEQGFVFSRCL